MKNFKTAPIIKGKNKNLTHEDLDERLQIYFNVNDNHNLDFVVNFEDTYDLDPIETIWNLEEAGYNTTKHWNYKKEKIIIVSLNNETLS